MRRLVVWVVSLGLCGLAPAMAAPGRRLHTLTLRSLGRGVDVDALGVAP